MNNLGTWHFFKSIYKIPQNEEFLELCIAVILSLIVGHITHKQT